MGALDLVLEGGNYHAVPCASASRCVVAHPLRGGATRRSSRLASLASASDPHGNFRLRVLAGQRFGRLIAESSSTSNRHGQQLWSCRCACGHQAVVAGADEIARDLLTPRPPPHTTRPTETR